MGVTVAIGKISGYDSLDLADDWDETRKVKIKMTPTTYVAVVEADHTVKAPAHLHVGEQVLVIRMPSAIELFKDVARRTRFAATRQAIQNALCTTNPAADLSDEEIVTLVKRARRATKSG